MQGRGRSPFSGFFKRSGGGAMSGVTTLVEDDEAWAGAVVVSMTRTR